MKKIIPIFIVGVLVLSGLGAVAVTETEDENFMSETIAFSQPMIKDNEKYAVIALSEATSSSLESGKPIMPVVTKVYTFPFGTKIDTVDVTFSEKISQRITKLIEPAPEPQMVSTVYKTQTENAVDYSELSIYPESTYNYRAGAGLKGEEHVIYLFVSLQPVQYAPCENTIYYYSQATIDISYTPPENPVIFGDAYDLLIITPAEFESTLQQLVDFKNENGVPTTMVTLEDIPNVGVDKQESIKYYIKDAIEGWGITYVLLVGSGLEGQEKFPVRYASIPSGDFEDSFPSDLYYADIYNGLGGFSDWDFDNDGKYAEFPGDILAVDVIPDVYLGKLPANSANEIKEVVRKIINYKEHNKMTKKSVHVGGDTFPGDEDNINEGEYANNAVIAKLTGYSATKIWASNGDMTKANIADGFKSGVDFVDFSGHGSTVSWATHAPNDESIWLPPETTLSPYHGFLYADFDVFFILNSKKLPVVFYNACSNNKYTETETCLSWKTLMKPYGGGIAAFGASGIGYGSPGIFETERLMGWMEVHTFEEILDSKIIGVVWGNCVTNYFANFWFLADEVDYKTMLEYSMFADPTVVIQDGDDPVNVPVYRPSANILERLLNNFPVLARLLENMVAKLN